MAYHARVVGCRSRPTRTVVCLSTGRNVHHAGVPLDGAFPPPMNGYPWPRVGSDAGGVEVPCAPPS